MHQITENQYCILEIYFQCAWNVLIVKENEWKIIMIKYHKCKNLLYVCLQLNVVYIGNWHIHLFEYWSRKCYQINILFSQTWHLYQTRVYIFCLCTVMFTVNSYSNERNKSLSNAHCNHMINLRTNSNAWSSMINRTKSFQIKTFFIFTKHPKSNEILFSFACWGDVENAIYFGVDLINLNVTLCHVVG